MKFQIVGEIRGIQTIAEGSGIREIAGLRKLFGPGHWRKKKGVATVQFR